MAACIRVSYSYDLVEGEGYSWVRIRAGLGLG